MKALKVLLLVASVGASPFFFKQNNNRRQRGFRQQSYRNQPFTAFSSYQQPQRYVRKTYSKPAQVTRFTQPAQAVGLRSSTAPIKIVNSPEVLLQNALDLELTKDSRITASTDGSSPAAAAALAYMREISNNDKDGFCGLPAQIFLEALLAGKSQDEAKNEAAKAYVKAYNRGERQVAGSACEKAEQAFRQAVVDGKDPILESGLAFVKNWKGLDEGNPCAVAGVEYVKAVINGKSNIEATTGSVAAFAEAFKKLAQAGLPLKDKACLESTKAFWNAIPASQKQDGLAKAFLAFSEKIFNGGAQAYDPVCLAGLEGFFASYLAGDDLLTSNLKSARAFFVEFQKGKSGVPANSACAAATLAYAQEIQNSPSGPAAAGMIAYIAEAIRSGERKLDPVCGEATLAYWDAYIADKSEAAANEAAAVAYLEALENNPRFDQTSACAKAAEAYIAEFD